MQKECKSVPFRLSKNIAVKEIIFLFLLLHYILSVTEIEFLQKRIMFITKDKSKHCIFQNLNMGATVIQQKTYLMCHICWTIFNNNVGKKLLRQNQNVYGNILLGRKWYLFVHL